MGIDPTKRNLQGVLRSAVVVFGFFALLIFLPLFASWHLLEILELKEVELCRKNASEELQEITAHLARLAKPETACGELAERLSRAFTWNENIRTVLAKWPENAVQIYLFDSNGRRIERSGCVSGMRIASERVFAMIRRAAKEGHVPLSPIESSQAESFLGSPSLLALIALRPNNLQDGSFVGVSKYIGWYIIKAVSGQTAGHFLIFIDQKKIDPQKLAAEACSRIGRLSVPDIRLGMVHLGNVNVALMSNGASIPIRSAKKLVRLPMRSIYESKRVLLALSDTSEGIRLFAMRAVPKMPDFYSKMRGFLVVLGLGLLLLSFWWIFFAGGVSMPLRIQLLGWFGLAAVAGLVSVLGFARVYGEVRRSALIKSTQEAAVRVLQKTDGNFAFSFAFLTKRYKEIAQTLENAPNIAQVIEPPLAALVKKHAFAAAFYVTEAEGIKSKIVSTPGSTVGRFAVEQSSFVRNLLYQVIEQFNVKRSVGMRNNKKSTALSPLSRLLAQPIDQLIRQRGTLQPFTLNDINATVFLEIVSEKDGSAKGAFFIMHDTNALEGIYLSNMAEEFSQNTSHNLLALPKKSSQAVSAIPTSFLGSRREVDLERLLELTDLTGSIQHASGRVKGERMLITALPGQMVSDYHLFLLTPVQPIEDQVRAVSRRINFFAFAVAVFAMALAWLFGGLLLEPMRTLTAGINRLGEMQLEEAVVIKTGDELQQIGDGITEIMEDLKERALAKTVQEQLLSNKPLTVLGCHVQGWNRTASDIGGEIFDFLTLPGGEIVFAVGDVAARGISAALVMAMAKTAVRVFLEETKAAPAVVLSELDGYFRVNTRRLSKIGMFLGVFNPQTSILRYAASGRLFPFFSAPGSVPQLLSVDGDGLGVGSSGKSVSEHAITLKPKERLVICTDGIIDARDRAGRPLGIEGISEILQKMSCFAPEKIGDMLWSELNAWRGEMRPEDDQTILLFECLSESVSLKAESPT